MTTKHDDGGPAYPRQYDDVQHDGETIWDRYAAAVIQGLSSNDSMLERSIEAMCATAGIIADEMVKERRKRGIGS